MIIVLHGMKNMRNNLYLKLFFETGIPFGIWMGILHSLQEGIRPGLIYGLAQGIFFGGFMAIIVGVSHRRAVKRISQGNPADKMGVHHFRNVELQIPYPEAFDLCLESLDSIKKYGSSAESVGDFLNSWERMSLLEPTPAFGHPSCGGD